MLRPLVRTLCVVCCASACQTYAPAPVDLHAHAQAFAARLASVPGPIAFAAQLRADAAAPPNDPAQPDPAQPLELPLPAARRLAVWFHPDCRVLRLQAGVAKATADYAGRLADPYLNLYVGRLQGGIQNPWLLISSIAFTVPLGDRLSVDRELQHSRHRQALVQASIAEVQAQDRLDATWARYSAELQRATLLQQLVDQLRELEQIANRLAAVAALNNAQARAFTLERLQRETELLLARGAVQQEELLLKQAIGLHPAAPVRFVPSLAIGERVPSGDVRKQSLIDSPRLLPLQQGHVIAEQQLQLAVASQWPDLLLQPGLENEDATPRLAFAFGIPLPIFTGARKMIAEATAAREVAAEALRTGYERLVQDLALAEARRAWAAQRRQQVDTELLPLAEQQLTDGRRLAELGQLDPWLLLDAVVRAYEAKAQLVDTALAEALATVDTNTLFWPPPASMSPPGDEETAR